MATTAAYFLRFILHGHPDSRAKDALRVLVPQMNRDTIMLLMVMWHPTVPWEDGDREAMETTLDIQVRVRSLSEDQHGHASSTVASLTTLHAFGYNRVFRLRRRCKREDHLRHDRSSVGLELHGTNSPRRDVDTSETSILRRTGSASSSASYYVGDSSVQDYIAPALHPDC